MKTYYSNELKRRVTIPDNEDNTARDKGIREALSKTFERLLQDAGDTPEVRLLIANYTLGYMGASYGLHVA